MTLQIDQQPPFTVGRNAYRGLQRPAGANGHSHTARGVRVDTAAADPEGTHVHRTPLGGTEPAPNRPGHQHRLPTGHWTSPSAERWSSIGVGRL